MWELVKAGGWPMVPLLLLGVEAWIHEIVRKKILHEQAVFTRRSFTEPEAVKRELLAGGEAASRVRLRCRYAFHTGLPAVAAAHRLHP